MEDMLKLLDWRRFGININGEYMTHLRFANDIVVMAEILEDLSRMLEDLNRVSQQVGLKMNMDKTKIVSNSRGRLSAEMMMKFDMSSIAFISVSQYTFSFTHYL
jgi:hypothetical protein